MSTPIDITIYKEALAKAKQDLENANHRLAAAQEETIIAEHEIVELRETIAALSKLCGEPEFIEEDSLGLTDIVRQVFKTTFTQGGLDAQAVREKIERMGYGGRWANLLASVHTIIKRLHEKNEIEVVTNTNGSYYYRWALKRGAIANAFAQMMTDAQTSADAAGSGMLKQPEHPMRKAFGRPRKTFGQKIGDGLFSDGKKK